MVRLEKVLCRSALWRSWTRKVVLPWAMQGLQPSGEGLEIGAGSGAMAAELLRAFPTLTLMVTDYDRSMLDAGRADLETFGDRAETTAADATGLPFDEARFDFVFSFIMLHHVVEWEKAIGEAMRVLKPGGWLVGYDLLDSRSFRMFHRLERAEVRLIHASELETGLDQVGADRAILTKSGWGPVLRFRVRKTAG